MKILYLLVLLLILNLVLGLKRFTTLKFPKEDDADNHAKHFAPDELPNNVTLACNVGQHRLYRYVSILDTFGMPDRDATKNILEADVLITCKKHFKTLTGHSLFLIDMHMKNAKYTEFIPDWKRPGTPPYKNVKDITDQFCY
jgi:hypothetical protein